jgi:hypothetical protein
MKLIPTIAAALVLGATTIVNANAASTPLWIGQLVQTDDADRTVVIEQGTRYVNVTQGEKVKFVANGKEYVIDFNGVDRNTDLRNLLPAGTLDHEIITYVGQSPFTLPN